MDRNGWRIAKASELIGVPHLDTKYLPPNVVIELRRRLLEHDDIGAAVLYGSVVRGEASPKSDIDLMVIPRVEVDVDNFWSDIRQLLTELETEYDLEISFSHIVYTGNEDDHFLWEVVRDGVVVLCRAEMVIRPSKEAVPHALITYSFRGLPLNVKRKVIRFLFESDNGVGIDMNERREYIARGVLFLSLERAQEVTEYFDIMNVKYGLRKIWY